MLLALSLALLLLGFAYGLTVSYLAFRQTGKIWMLFLPQWIDAGSGVSRRLRHHGMLAFGVLFIGTILFFIQLR